jgi:hypothetical protein
MLEGFTQVCDTVIDAFYLFAYKESFLIFFLNKNFKRKIKGKGKGEKN